MTYEEKVEKRFWILYDFYSDAKAMISVAGKLDTARLEKKLIVVTKRLETI